MQNYFEDYEHECKCGCGLKWTPAFKGIMNAIRDEAGVPMPVSSGARCERHDKNEGGAGVHPECEAGDIQVSGKAAHAVLKAATKLGITGIGISQKNKDHSKRFIHLDIVERPTRPWVWSY